MFIRVVTLKKMRRNCRKAHKIYNYVNYVIIYILVHIHEGLFIVDILFISYLLAASSFLRSSNSSTDTSLGKELLLVYVEGGVDSEASLLVVDMDRSISTGFSAADPFRRLGALIEGIVFGSVVASDMSTSFAEPVDELESVEDTDSIDDLRLAESSLLIDIVEFVAIVDRV